MTEGLMQFRGLIYSKYRNEAALASAMGWNRQRLNKITTGKRVPTLMDLSALSTALSCSLEQLAGYFLS